MFSSKIKLFIISFLMLSFQQVTTMNDPHTPRREFNTPPNNFNIENNNEFPTPPLQNLLQQTPMDIPTPPRTRQSFQQRVSRARALLNADRPPLWRIQGIKLSPINQSDLNGAQFFLSSVQRRNRIEQQNQRRLRRRRRMVDSHQLFNSVGTDNTILFDTTEQIESHLTTISEADLTLLGLSSQHSQTILELSSQHSQTLFTPRKSNQETIIGNIDLFSHPNEITNLNTLFNPDYKDKEGNNMLHIVLKKNAPPEMISHVIKKINSREFHAKNNFSKTPIDLIIKLCKNVTIALQPDSLEKMFFFIDYYINNHRILPDKLLEWMYNNQKTLSTVNPSRFLPHIQQYITNLKNRTCPICFANFAQTNRPTSVAACGHPVCTVCFMRQLAHNKCNGITTGVTCPTCRAQITTVSPLKRVLNPCCLCHKQVKRNNQTEVCCTKNCKSIAHTNCFAKYFATDHILKCPNQSGAKPCQGFMKIDSDSEEETEIPPVILSRTTHDEELTQTHTTQPGVMLYLINSWKSLMDK